MAINLKNPAAVDAVRKLAEHLGVNYTDAVCLAAKHVLKLPSESAEQAAAREIEKILDEYQSHLGPDDKLSTDSLYDENGLFA